MEATGQGGGKKMHVFFGLKKNRLKTQNFPKLLADEPGFDVLFS